MDILDMEVPLVAKALNHPLLTIEYPFHLRAHGSPGPSFENGPSLKIPLRTFACALWALAQGCFYATFPLTILLMLLYGISYFWIIIVVVLGMRDEMTRRALGWNSSVSPGLYYVKTATNQQIVANWDANKRAYEKPRWCWSGDLCTFILFLMNSMKHMHPPIRTWLRVPVDDSNTSCEEAVALDWFVPKDGEVSAIILIFHGLNGDSSEPYIVDFTQRALKQGYACVVMVARGMHGMPVRSDYMFNGARISDAFAALQLLANLDLPLHAVGFSIGAVVLSNLLARKGDDITGLRSAVSICGAVNFRVGLDDKYIGRCRRLWQPLLAFGIVQTMAQYASIVERRIGVKNLGAPTDIKGFDQTVIAPSSGFGSGPTGLVAYYHEMSIAPFEAPCELLMRINPKMLFIHACDDPIMPIDQYEEAIKTPAENALYLFTAGGGHIGFPVGTACWKNAWQWQSEAALSFLDAVNRGLDS